MSAVTAAERQMARAAHQAHMDSVAEVSRDLATTQTHAGYRPPANEQPIFTTRCRFWSQAGRGRDVRPDADPVVLDYRMTVPSGTDLRAGDIVSTVTNTVMHETYAGRLIVRDVLKRASYLIATLEEVR